MRTLIEAGTVLTATETFVADVVVENGKIAALLSAEQATTLQQIDERIDARGNYVFPGAIDAHTHLDMPFGGTTSSDDFETGTTAAAHGGTTTIIDREDVSRGRKRTLGRSRRTWLMRSEVVNGYLDTWHAKAEGKATTDYAFHMIATDLPANQLEAMSAIVVRAGRISMNRFVEMTSTAPAEIFGLYPRKGSMGIGADADLVVWDPEKRHTLSVKSLHMRVDYSPVEGCEVVGYPTVVMQRGRTLVREGKFLGKAGQGQFQRRATWSL